MPMRAREGQKVVSCLDAPQGQVFWLTPQDHSLSPNLDCGAVADTAVIRQRWRSMS